MRTQPTFFGYAATRTSQPRLFDCEGPRASSLRCEECGSYLERTPGGYLACPNGHGRLSVEQPADEPPEVDEASLFDASDLDTGMPAR
jgi:hypothetical protein